MCDYDCMSMTSMTDNINNKILLGLTPLTNNHIECRLHEMMSVRAHSNSTIAISFLRKYTKYRRSIQ